MNLIVAMLSVFTSASGRTFITTSTRLLVSSMSLDAPDFDAGHFHAVALFEVLHVG